MGSTAPLLAEIHALRGHRGQIEVASAMTCSADDDFDQARNHMPAGQDHRPASVLGAPAWALR